MNGKLINMQGAKSIFNSYIRESTALETLYLVDVHGAVLSTSGSSASITKTAGALFGKQTKRLSNILEIPDLKNVFNASMHNRRKGSLRKETGDESHTFYVEPMYGQKDALTGAMIRVVISTEQVNPSEQFISNFCATYMDHVPLLAWVKNDSGKYEYINRKFEEVLGVKKQDIIGHTDELIFPAGKAAEVIGLNDSIIREWNSYESEETLLYNSKPCVFKVLRFPVKSFDGRAYVGGFAYDVSEHIRISEQYRQSESRLIEAEKLAGMGSWEMNIRTDSHKWSEGMFNLLGLSAGKDAVPSLELFSSCVHEEDLSRTLNEIKKASNTFSNAAFNFRFINQTNGMERVAKAQWKFEFDSQLRPFRLHGLLTDITEQFKQEMERQSMINDILERNKNLEQFSFIVSHNLRAPVTNILAITDLLSNNQLSEDDQFQLSKALSDSARKLDSVIEDLSDILNSKNPVSEKKELIEMPDLLSEICQGLKTSIEDSNAVFDIDFEDTSRIYSLKTYIRSIFYNLISNSLKYHKPQEPPMIVIRGKRRADQVIFTIEDKGLGMDLKSNQVFGMYKRFHPEVAEGKGLGLYLVKTQVETLGGTISVESETNRGTLFTINLKSV